MNCQENLKTLKLSDGQEVVIREAVEADALSMIDFVKQINIESDYLLTAPDEFNWPLDKEVAWIKSNYEKSGSIILIGVVGSKVISITNAMSGEKKRTAHIAQLGTSVAKSYREQGIGSLMMSELHVWAKNNSIIEYLQLSVMGDNNPARSLYEKKGFLIVGKIPRAFKFLDGSYQDEVIMSLKV